jgi:hypothetical protein
MADTASAPKASKPKVLKPKKAVEHPGFTAMITEAIASLKEVSACLEGLADRPAGFGLWGLQKLSNELSTM